MTLKSPVIRHMISFLYSNLQIIGNLVYIKKYKEAKHFQIFKLKTDKDPKKPDYMRNKSVQIIIVT